MLSPKTVLQAGVGLTISLLSGWVLLRTVDPVQVGAAIAQVSGHWLLAGVAAYFAGLWFRAQRWRDLLAASGAGRISRRGTFSLTLIGLFANDILPARAGEVVRAWTFRNRYGTPVPTLLGTIAIERVLDAAALVALGVLAAMVNHGLPMPVMGGLAALGLVAWSLLLLVLIGGARPAPARAAFAHVVALLPRSLGRRAEASLGAFLDGFLGLGPRRLPRVLACTAMVWGAEWSVYAAVAAGLRSGPLLSSSLVGVSAGNLATVIPSSPGFAGTFDAAVASTLLSVGWSQASAGAYAVLAHTVVLVPVIAAGLLVVLFGRYSLRPAGQARQDHAPSLAAQPSLP